jgi:hypothetical protein
MEALLIDNDPIESIDPAQQLKTMMARFLAIEDLKGMCGVAVLATIRRQDAILATYMDAQWPDAPFDPPVSEFRSRHLATDYDQLLNECLSNLLRVAKTGEERALVSTMTEAIHANNLEFEAYQANIEEEQVLPPPPQWTLNHFLAQGKLLTVSKDDEVTALLKNEIPTLRDHREDLGADLLSYGVMNRELRGPILEIMESEGPFSTPATLVQLVFSEIKKRLPAEATTSMEEAINYLADQFALERDIHGYVLGAGIVPRPKAAS